MELSKLKYLFREISKRNGKEKTHRAFRWNQFERFDFSGIDFRGITFDKEKLSRADLRDINLKDSIGFRWTQEAWPCTDWKFITVIDLPEIGFAYYFSNRICSDLGCARRHIESGYLGGCCLARDWERERLRSIHKIERTVDQWKLSDERKAGIKRPKAEMPRRIIVSPNKMFLFGVTCDHFSEMIDDKMRHYFEVDYVRGCYMVHFYIKDYLRRPIATIISKTDNPYCLSFTIGMEKVTINDFISLLEFHDPDWGKALEWLKQRAYPENVRKNVKVTFKGNK